MTNMDAKAAYGKRQEFGELEETIKENFKDMRKKLKEKTYDLDNQDENEKTVLIKVVEQRNYTEQMWVLLDYGADPNIPDKDGKTALHYAVQVERRDMVICLLLFGADTEAKDIEGKGALDDYRWEDLNTIREAIDSIKREFICLTRKRRKFLKYIFDEIDKEFSTKQINMQTLGAYYERINKESPESALKDAQSFISSAKLIKSQFEENQTLSFEEFIVAICKIVKYHGMKVIDEFINRFLKIRVKTKPKVVDENAEGEGDNKE